MKLVVLGATGNIGSNVVSQALDAGHTVTAIVRNAASLAPRDGLTIVEGSLSDVAFLTSTFTGADVVVCAIGGKPKDRLLSKLLPSIGEAINASGTRLVLVSAFGAGDSSKKASAFARAIYATVVRPVFQDKVDSESAVLPTLTAPWTIILPVNLKKGDRAPEQTVIDIDDVAAVPGLPTLPFANAAAGILDVVADTSLNGKRMLITTAKGYKRQH